MFIKRETVLFGHTRYQQMNTKHDTHCLLTANLATTKSVSHSFLNPVWSYTMATASKHHHHVSEKLQCQYLQPFMRC